MFLRIITSAPLGVAATASLLMLMSLLIESGPEAATNSEGRKPLVVVMVKPREEIIVKEDNPKRIDPPVQPPVTPGPEMTTEGLTGQRLGPTTAPVPDDFPDLDFGPGTNSLVNIIKVKPQYPAKAQRLGLEGYVIVAFDVTGAGTVVNVRVVDSSNGIFNNEAIKAAQRFRYNARVVDGEPVATYGLMNKFTFTMEE